MGEYRLTPAAKSDLINIWKYTSEKWGVKQAEKYLIEIEQKLEKLASNPNMGRIRPEIKEGYYSFPVEKHVIFYLILENYIAIIGILHGKMDIDKNLIH